MARRALIVPKNPYKRHMAIYAYIPPYVVLSYFVFVFPFWIMIIASVAINESHRARQNDFESDKKKSWCQKVYDWIRKNIRIKKTSLIKKNRNNSINGCGKIRIFHRLIIICMKTTS